MIRVGRRLASAAIAATVVAGPALAALTSAACGGSQMHPPDTFDYEGPSPSASAAASGSTSSASASPTASAAVTATAPSASGSADASAGSSSAHAKAPDQIAARHVLVQWIGCRQAGPEIVRNREQALSVVKEVLRRARAGESFDRLAAEYSDEPGAGRRGGGLPRFGRGVMDKTFEQSAFALQVGEISNIVETPFGFHVIQRTE